MELSVVVPTLNGREHLARCLDALTEHAPSAEVVVVNGPSADGTTGMVRDRDDVDVLVEVADRTVTAARNAGIEHASGDAVALVDHDLVVTEGWVDGVRDALADGDVVTGPTQRRLSAGVTTQSVESRRIAGREVTYFNSGNVAFDRAALDEADGYDEYLAIGGSRDLAHRLAALGYDVEWDDRVNVRCEYGTDGGVSGREWDWRYRSLAYRLVKNYGARPSVLARVARHAGVDAYEGLAGVVRGDGDPSEWVGTGRTVIENALLGSKDGLWARRLDRTERRNPRGRSARADRAVEVYDWR